jgi:hypothetical protein
MLLSAHTGLVAAALDAWSTSGTMLAALLPWAAALLQERPSVGGHAGHIEGRYVCVCRGQQGGASTCHPSVCSSCGLFPLSLLRGVQRYQMAAQAPLSGGQAQQTQQRRATDGGAAAAAAPAPVIGQGGQARGELQLCRCGSLVLGGGLLQRGLAACRTLHLCQGAVLPGQHFPLGSRAAATGWPGCVQQWWMPSNHLGELGCKVGASGCGAGSDHGLGGCRHGRRVACKRCQGMQCCHRATSPLQEAAVPLNKLTPSSSSTPAPANNMRAIAGGCDGCCSSGHAGLLGASCQQGWCCPAASLPWRHSALTDPAARASLQTHSHTSIYTHHQPPMNIIAPVVSACPSVLTSTSV